MKKMRTSGRARFAAVAVAVGAFASLGGVGYAAGLVHFAHSSPTNAQYPPSKVTICHHTHSQKNPFVTITVSEHALPAHLGHGDTIGACSEQGSTETQAQTEKVPKVHGAHQSSHGNHGDKSHANSAKDPAGTRGHGNQGKSGSHGSKAGPSGVHGKGHGKGKGHDPAHGQGQGHGQGQAHGQGHGPGDNHGNSGGGKGNGHKP